MKLHGYFFSCARALIVALAILSLFLEDERILAVTSVMPASSNTIFTDEPATMPRLGAGRMDTVPEDSFADTSCGILMDSVVATRIMCFFASRMAFSMASAVSPALPKPTHTLPFLDR